MTSSDSDMSWSKSCSEKLQGNNHDSERISSEDHDNYTIMNMVSGEIADNGIEPMGVIIRGVYSIFSVRRHVHG